MAGLQLLKMTPSRQSRNPNPKQSVILSGVERATGAVHAVEGPALRRFPSPATPAHAAAARAGGAGLLALRFSASPNLARTRGPRNTTRRRRNAATAQHFSAGKATRKRSPGATTRSAHQSPPCITARPHASRTILRARGPASGHNFTGCGNTRFFEGHGFSCAEKWARSTFLAAAGPSAGGTPQRASISLAPCPFIGIDPRGDGIPKELTANC